MEEITQAASLFLRIAYFLLGIGHVYIGIAMIAGRGTTPGSLEERIPLKRVPSKTRLPYGLYHLALGLALSLSSLFMPEAWPWIFFLFMPFFFFPTFVINPGLKRRAAAIRAAPDGCPDA